MMCDVHAIRAMHQKAWTSACFLSLRISIFTKRIKSSEWHLAGQVEIPLQEGRGVLCVPNESFAIHKNFSIQAFDFDGFVLKKFV